MTLWIDADACPVTVRQILFRAAERTATPLVLVANQQIATPPSALVRMQQVPRGFDVADNEIARQVQPGDLVVTGDIPLAAEVIAKGALALTSRGDLFDANNIGEALAMRDFMQGLRDSGLETGGHGTYSNSDAQAFANQLDRYLARQPT